MVTDGSRTPTQHDFKGLLSMGQSALCFSGAECARRDAQLLLCAASGYDRAMLLSRAREKPSQLIVDRFFSFISRRIKREPIQYIVGEWEFMGLPFIVNCDALIPRPETERLVESVIGALGDCAAPLVLDMCTGSGCVAISLATLLDNSTIIATDISASALRLAEKNARLNNVSQSIIFIEGDMYHPVAALSQNVVFDAISANPPYVTSGELAMLPEDIRLYEPHVALDGGADGLAFFHKIAEGAASRLKPSGFLAVETGASQSQQVENIFMQHGFTKTWTECDMSGHTRIVLASR